jgi:hypothetical protein
MVALAFGLGQARGPVFHATKDYQRHAAFFGEIPAKAIGFLDEPHGPKKMPLSAGACMYVN